MDQAEVASETVLTNAASVASGGTNCGAASVIFTVPIIVAFFFAQKTFIQGIKLTGLKE